MKMELQAQTTCLLREILELAEEDRGSYAIERLARIAELARSALAADEKSG